MRLELHLRLVSDATFGRGDGVTGLVDTEVEYDEYGLPYLRGRTLKGLLVEECANLLFALEQQNPAALGELEQAARYLFGQAGSTLDTDAMMRVGPASLPEDLRAAVTTEVVANEEAKRDRQPSRGLSPMEVLESLTAIRRQTAVDTETDAPEEGSLRSARVVLRETPLIAQLDFDETVSGARRRANALALLAACTLSLRRGGIGRNRGRGRLVARLHDPSRLPGQTDITREQFQRFKELVSGKGVQQ